MVKGIVLFSGGLDSMLSVKVCQEQGIEILAVSFTTPFFRADKARKAALHAGVPLTVLDITDEHLIMLKSPRYGYGKNMNPCIDCHTLMVRVAGKLMEEQGADFIATGEVLGQRPMSQGKNSLNNVAKNSGYKDFLIRPLSAKLLTSTKPELAGKVDRERLLAISGRGRKEQMRLAEYYGITQYENPAGGCLLTDVIFSKKLKDIFQYHPEHKVTDIEMLEYGRHFRINDKMKVIVGRSKSENDFLEELASGGAYWRMRAANFPSPTVVIAKNCTLEELLTAAGLCLLYSDAPNDEENEVLCFHGESTKTISILPAGKEFAASCILM